MKQILPKEVTEEGIVMLVKLEQSQKHSELTVLTEEGIIMLVKLEHPLKQE